MMQSLMNGQIMRRAFALTLASSTDPLQNRGVCVPALTHTAR